MASIKNMTRRNFLSTLATASTALLTGVQSTAEALFAGNARTPANWSSSAIPDFDAVRADFPRAARKLWLAAAEIHPFSVHTLRAIENYSQFRALGPGAGRMNFTRDMQSEVKRLFADLINAKPEEIAFVMSTTEGENIVAAGMDLARRATIRSFPFSWHESSRPCTRKRSDQ
jgi:hypothetical protein